MPRFEGFESGRRAQGGRHLQPEKRFEGGYLVELWWTVMMAGAPTISATAFVEGRVQDASNDACSSKTTMTSMAAYVDGGVENASSDQSSAVPTVVGAAVFVEEGHTCDDDDACSICLENFCEQNPSTITNCNHEYHLHCILEWSQRGKECPMCWQPLSLKDSDSQTLLAASQQQRFTYCLRSSPFYQVSARDESQVHRIGASQGGDLNLEDRSVSGRARGPRSLDRGALDPSSIRQFTSLERQEEVQHGRSSNPSLSETFTFKSRLVAASFKYRDSFSKTTRGLRERLRLRSHGTVVDLGSRVTELSAGVVRSSRDGEH